MTKEKIKDAIILLKVLSNPARFNILRVLLSAREKRTEMCVNEIAERVKISQSLASHQLALLEARELVCSSRMGQMTCYKVCDSPLMAQVEKIIKIFDS